MKPTFHPKTTTQTRAQGRRVPDLIESATELRLDPGTCDIEYWLHAVAQGSLLGQVHGHSPGARVPAYLLRPGPLRSALLEELAFRTISEEMGTCALTHLVRTAPTRATMDFYATQLLDEARHAAVFRRHLVDLGIAEERLGAFLEEVAGDKRDAVLRPLEHFALETAGGREDFIAGVVMLTVIVEGVLAPASEMSERKWRRLDPPAAEAAHGANLDEVRHLCVGSAVVRDHLGERPEERERLLGLVAEGLGLWRRLPIEDVILRRERWFQEGMAEVAEVLGDYELVPGRRLLDTGIEERLGLQMAWSQAMQAARLGYMGLLPAGRGGDEARELQP
ncbi:MAG TPA: VlmB-like protein [Polyangia bacterium]|nr:VlmB-like protein [Polyangia bacterium]